MSAKLRSHAAAATLISLAAALVLIVVGLLTLSGAEAADKQPSCGDTVTVDTTLDSDLLDCPSNGIVIGADNVTLDLDGHLIEGDGSEFEGCGRREFCDVGVLVLGHDGVTVKNGSTRRFGVGVLIGDSRNSEVRKVSSSRNDVFGVVLSEAKRTLVRGSSLSDNVPPEGDGIGMFGTRGTRLLENSIEHNPGPGMHVADSTRTLIKRNTFSDDSPAVLIEANRTEVRGNKITGGAGIIVNPPGNRNVIAHNRLRRATDSIAVEKGNNNVVADNVVIESRGPGIRLGIGNPSLGGSSNVVIRNEVRKSHDNGFQVYVKDRNSLLKKNAAVGSAGDGFHIESAKATLRQNRAVRNADLGIEAVEGVLGKGNVARQNGDRRQCIHIACR